MERALMKRLTAFAFVVLGGFVLAAPSVTVLAQRGPAWTVLFDGKNLDNFNQIGGANWKITDGVVEANMGMAGFLVSKASYTDFEFKADFWVTDDANSGVFIRCENPQM